MTSADAPPQRRHLGRSGAALFIGTLASNVLSYGFFVILSRHLSEDALGAVGSLVNLSIIGSVPALGLQLVAARTVARAHDAGDEDALRTVDAKVMRLALDIGAVATVLLVALSPVLGQVLHLDTGPVLVLALALVPISITFAVQGILQGEERFTGLSFVYGLSGLTKFVAAAGAALLGHGVLGVVALFVAGWAVTSVVGLFLLPPRRRLPGRGTPWPLARTVLTSVVSTSGLLFLSSIDVLLARHHLSAVDSGGYTVGALFEKAAFWGPSFLATLFYPRMAIASQRRAAVIRALGTTVGAGVVGVVATAVLGGPLVTVVGGAGYADLGGIVWLFTALGVSLAVVQVIVYAGLAQGDVRPGVAVWALAVVAVGVVQVRHASILEVVTAILGCASLMVLIGMGLLLRSRTSTVSSRAIRGR